MSVLLRPVSFRDFRTCQGFTVVSLKWTRPSKTMVILGKLAYVSSFQVYLLRWHIRFQDLMMNLSKLLVPITLDSKPFLQIFQAMFSIHFPHFPTKVHSARAPKCRVVFFVTFFRYGGADSYPIHLPKSAVWNPHISRYGLKNTAPEGTVHFLYMFHDFFQLTIAKTTETSPLFRVFTVFALSRSHPFTARSATATLSQSH